MKNLGVLWDMDGVIVDTGKFHFLSWMKTFEESGVPFDEKVFNRTFGMNNTDILEWVLGYKPDPDEIARVSDRKESIFRQLITGKAELLPGIKKWLDYFNENGAKQAIASSAPIKNIEVLLDELSINHLFDVIVSGAELPGKPNPDVFLKAAEAIGIPPERCIVIEDAIAGVEGAKRAGMGCIAVTTTNPAEKLAKADLVFTHLEEMSEHELLSLIE